MTRYFNFKSYNYSNIIPQFIESNLRSPAYLIINNFTIYPNDNQFLSFIDIKVNKRGGDTSKIKFSAQNLPIKIGDKVDFFVNNKKQYTGYIEQEKYINEIFELIIIPEWSRLRYSIVSGGIVLEETLPIITIVKSLFPLIVQQDIGVSLSKVIIPIEYEITISTMGKNIVDILDECENALPQGYVWGVINNTFFFFLQNEEPKILLNWRLNDFSNSNINEDFSQIYTQTSVFVQEKDPDNNTQNRSIGIVGSGGNYPLIPFFQQIGVKMNKLEFPFEIQTNKALDFAYNLLQNQYVPVDIKIQNLNFSQKFPIILEGVTVLSKPQTFLTKRFSKISTNLINSQFNSFGGFIQKTNKATSTNTLVSDIYEFNLSDNLLFLEYCNGSEQITNLVIEYISSETQVIFRITDGEISKSIAGSFGKAIINFKGVLINKRRLKIECITKSASFGYKDVFVTFTNAQTIFNGNIRKINYKMDNKFIFSIDLEIANLGTVMNGYLFKENKKIEKLSDILSLSEV